MIKGKNPSFRFQFLSTNYNVSAEHLEVGCGGASLWCEELLWATWHWVRNL